MSTVTIIIIFIVLCLVLYLIVATARLRNNDKLLMWEIREETATKLILEIRLATKIVVSIDLEAGVITLTETQPDKILSHVELSISRVDQILLTFEDAPSGVAHLAPANLAFITTERKKITIIKKGKLSDIAPIAKKIALILHKKVEDYILPYGAFMKDVTGSEIEKVPFWSIKEETANKLVLQIESTDTVFDLDSGIITRTESQQRAMSGSFEVPISQVDKLLLTFEDAPTGIDPYAKLALITTQGEKLQIIRGDRYSKVVSPMAKKIASFIDKAIQEEILEFGTLWKEAG